MTVKETVIYPEDRLALKWDLCLSDALLKTAVGTGLGVVFSMLAFNRRPWPVALGFGTGLGMSISNCRHELSKQRHIAASLDKTSPYYGKYYDYEPRGGNNWWTGFNKDRRREVGPKFVEVVEEETRYDPNYYKNLKEKLKDTSDRAVYKGERKLDQWGNEIKSTYDSVEGSVKSAGKKLDSKLDSAGRKLESGIKHVGHKIEDGFEKIEDGFKHVGDKIESGLKKAGTKIERGLQGTGEEIDRELHYGAKTLNRGLNRAANKVDSAFYDSTYGANHWRGRTPAENVEYAAWRQSHAFTDK